MRDIFDDDGKDEGSGDFAQMFENSMGNVGKKLKAGDRIRGELLTIGKEEAFVSTGTVDDGIVIRADLLDEKGQLKYKVGDFIDVFVTRVQGSQIMLSTRPTAKNVAEDLEDAFDMMLPIEGRVSEAVNGGFRVLIDGVTAFCPMSQIDSRRVDDPAAYIGKKFEFMITKFDSRGKNIVVSRRKLLDEQKDVAIASFEDAHKPGDTVKGVITRLEKFGAFIELYPGVEGLCHISELSHSRVNDPRDVVAVGQQVSAKILKVEQGLNGRMNVALSIKQGLPTPWENLPATIREGQIVEGKVTRNMKFGSFVEVAPGIEGLVPLSEMSDVKRIVNASEVCKEGDRISVLIKEIRLDEQRLLLSIKDADPDRGEAIQAMATNQVKSAKSLGTLADQFKGLFDPSAPTASTKGNSPKPKK